MTRLKKQIRGILRLSSTPSEFASAQELHTPEQRLIEFLDYRLVIETGVVELAAQRTKDIWETELQQLVNAMQRVEGSSCEYRKLDLEFHLLLASMTRNTRLTRVMVDLQAELSDLLLKIPHSRALHACSTRQHQRLIDAVRIGEPEIARLIMKDHLSTTSDYLKNRCTGSFC